MLGGMLGWPGTAWDRTSGSDTPPMNAGWTELTGEVRHTFSHFHLRLTVRVAHVDADARPQRGSFIPPANFRPSDLPTVMRKAYDLAADAFTRG